MAVGTKAGIRMPEDYQRGTWSVGGTSTFPVPDIKTKTFKGLVIGIQATQRQGLQK